jgi:hypothetical protein
MNGVKWCRCLRHGPEVLALFLTFMRLQNLVGGGGVFRTTILGFGISIGDTYVNDTISSSGPKAMDQHISLIFAFVLVKLVVDLRTPGLFHLNCSANIMDF